MYWGTVVALRKEHACTLTVGVETRRIHYFELNTHQYQWNAVEGGYGCLRCEPREYLFLTPER